MSTKKIEIFKRIILSLLRNLIPFEWFLHFVFYIVRIYDQVCFEVYSQPNLLDRMLRQHPYQPCTQDFCTNIQYNPKDGMLRILLLIAVI